MWERACPYASQLRASTVPVARELAPVTAQEPTTIQLMPRYLNVGGGATIRLAADGGLTADQDVGVE